MKIVFEFGCLLCAVEEEAYEEAKEEAQKDETEIKVDWRGNDKEMAFPWHVFFVLFIILLASYAEVVMGRIEGTEHGACFHLFSSLNWLEI